MSFGEHAKHYSYISLLMRFCFAFSFHAWLSCPTNQLLDDDVVHVLCCHLDYGISSLDFAITLMFGLNNLVIDLK